jgi:hypothetical protein
MSLSGCIGGAKLVAAQGLADRARRFSIEMLSVPVFVMGLEWIPIGGRDDGSFRYLGEQRGVAM